MHRYVITVKGQLSNYTLEFFADNFAHAEEQAKDFTNDEILHITKYEKFVMEVENGG